MSGPSAPAPPRRKGVSGNASLDRLPHPLDRILGSMGTGRAAVGFRSSHTTIAFAAAALVGYIAIMFWPYLAASLVRSSSVHALRFISPGHSPATPLGLCLAAAVGAVSVFINFVCWDKVRSASTSTPCRSTSAGHSRESRVMQPGVTRRRRSDRPCSAHRRPPSCWARRRCCDR
jgi:hypothetical protein